MHVCSSTSAHRQDGPHVYYTLLYWDSVHGPWGQTWNLPKKNTQRGSEPAKFYANKHINFDKKTWQKNGKSSFLALYFLIFLNFSLFILIFFPSFYPFYFFLSFYSCFFNLHLVYIYFTYFRTTARIISKPRKWSTSNTILTHTILWTTSTTNIWRK